MLRITMVLIIASSLFAQWTQVQSPDIPSWMFCNFIDAVDSNTVFFKVNNEFPIPFYISQNGGKSWVKKFTPEASGALVIQVIDSSMWICTETKVYHSSNLGNDWKLQLDATGKTIFLNYIKMFNKDEGIIQGDAITAADPFIVYRTTNGGEEWISSENSFKGSFSRDQFFTIDFLNLQTGYLYDSRSVQLLKTTNGGSEWNIVKHPANNLYMVKFYDENLGIIISDNGLLPYNDSLYRTTDGGVSWKTLPLVTKSVHHDIEFLPDDPSQIWFTDYYKLFFSRDTGNTWQEHTIISSSLGGRNIKFVDNNNGWLLCDYGRIYKTNNNGGITTNVKSNELQLNYDLSNYPNPFNPSTTIAYSVPERTLVELKIFDVLGKEITVLINEEKDAGNHHVRYNAFNLASGVYYYQLKTKNHLVSKKMILLK